MKTLIIGGSRFIGPHLIRELLALGHEITVFNRGTREINFPASVEVVKGDRAKGFSSLGGFDIVIDTCAYKPDQIEAVKKQIDFDYYLFVSTAAAYKKTDIFPLREDFSVLGDWPLWGDYNRGKAECEKYLATSGLAHACVRPVYILGQANYVDREAFIYRRLTTGATLKIPGNGQALAQFVFVHDVAKLIALIVASRLTGAFNCCQNETITLTGLVNEMAKIVGAPARFEFNHEADGARFREAEFPFANENFFCSCERARSLGFAPTPLLDGLRRDYNEYYRDFIKNV